MTYQTIFETANDDTLLWWLPGAGLFVIAGCALQPVFMSLTKQGPHRKAVTWAMLVFASIMTLVAFAVTRWQHRSVESCLHAANCPVVEGPVTKFTPTDHGMATFFVGGHYFTFTSKPLHEGLPVRITYLRNDILRFEVARP